MLEWCFKHQVLRLPGEPCAQCATDAPSADRIAAIVETLHIHSYRIDLNHDVLMTLEARIADQDAQIDGLKRRLRDAEDIINRRSERP